MKKEDSKAEEELITLRINELEKEIKYKTLIVKEEIRSVEELTSKLKLSEQQIELFTQECVVAGERMKDANWEFTKDVCLSLGRIQNPSEQLKMIATKFMIMLGQKESSWELFTGLTKNYDPLRNIMSTMNVELMTEATLSELLPIWKNFGPLRHVLQAEAVGAEIMLRWIVYSVELRLKKETLASTRSQLAEIQKKIKERLRGIVEKNMYLFSREKLKTKLQDQLKALQERKILDLRQYSETEREVVPCSTASIIPNYPFLEDPLKELCCGGNTIISFNSAKKPSPKRNNEKRSSASLLKSEREPTVQSPILTNIVPMSIVPKRFLNTKKPKDEIMAEDGSIIKIVKIKFMESRTGLG